MNDRLDAGTVVRSRELRPTLRQVMHRTFAVVVTNAIALALLAPVIAGYSVDDAGSALLAGLVIGVLNSMVWPAVAFLVVPIGVLTLGLGAVVLNAAVVWLLLDRIPGVEIDGFWASLALTIGLTLVTTLVTWLLAIEDVAWFDERMARRARRRRTDAVVTDVPGVVFIQIDGLAEPVLRRALAAGDVPTLHRWIDRGTHRVAKWETEWSSQTGVSQCGILHGSVADMPAFRWYEKDTGALIVSNRARSAAAIERRHGDGDGLLAHHGSSYGNLFTGDAERAALTMSVAGRVKEGRVGAGYGRYFSRPDNAVRTLLGVCVDVWRERLAARDQRRRDVEPRVDRGFAYSLLRAFTTVVSRDVCVNGVLGDIAEGRAAIYVDLLGYDEVAHHSGIERHDTLCVLRDIDRQVGRIERALAWAPRPYRIVVLSDHGQTQGPSFERRFGESLEALVARLSGTSAASDPDSGAGNTESTAWLRNARGDTAHPRLDAGELTVRASGSLGLIYFPGPARRLTLEEIDERHPGLVDGLRSHPGIGFLLVRSDDHGAMALGPRGRRCLDGEGEAAVEGSDPLLPFGPSAAAKVARVDRYPHVADIMVNARYDPELDETHAFEHQVGSHGGLGGPQNEPFVLYPTELARPPAVVDGPAELHRVLKGWLAELGQPVRTADRSAAAERYGEADDRGDAGPVPAPLVREGDLRVGEHRHQPAGRDRGHPRSGDRAAEVGGDVAGDGCDAAGQDHQCPEPAEALRGPAGRGEVGRRSDRLRDVRHEDGCDERSAHGRSGRDLDAEDDRLGNPVDDRADDDPHRAAGPFVAELLLDQAVTCEEDGRAAQHADPELPPTEILGLGEEVERDRRQHRPGAQACERADDAAGNRDPAHDDARDQQ